MKIRPATAGRLAALLGGTALVLIQPVPAAARVGVTSATEGDPMGRPPDGSERVLRIGVDVQANEIVTTTDKDRAHLLFLDGSSVTVGPNARLVIDRFVYDPATKTGALDITAAKGVFRLVGGKISKTNSINITTPSSTIGIRGGITIFTVTESQTSSTFVFGDKMTVSGQGQTQTVTRTGSTVTTTLGKGPGVPTLISQGALNGAIGSLEGQGQGQGQGGNQNPDTTSGALLASGPPGPPPINTGPRSPLPQLPPPPITKKSDPPTPPTPRVIVTQGHFLQEDTNTGFNKTTLAAPRIVANNQVLAPTGTVTGNTVTLATQDGRNLVLPWALNRELNFAGAGTIGRGIVSPTGDFFIYVLTDINTNKKTAVFGGDPTSKAAFPKSGMAEHKIFNVNENGNLPFADPLVGGNAALKNAATVSNLYSVYSERLGIIPPSLQKLNQFATSLQVTVSIAGVGADQKSYMGGVIGTYFTDYNNNSVFNSGAYVGSYRLTSSAPIGRLASAVSTADTAGGNAIYGPNAEYMVFTNDRTRSGVSGLAGVTTREPSLAYNQPYDNLNGTPYLSVNAAIKQDSTSIGNETRSNRTLKGFVGGLVEGRDASGANTPGTFTTRTIGNQSPDAVRLTTSATDNRASATVVLNNFGQNGATATFELGGNGLLSPNYSTSAFITDTVYGLRDQTDDRLRSTKVAVSSDNGAPTTYDVASRTVMTSYGAAPVAQFFAQQGVTPCTCDFMSWGWWSGDIAYDQAGFRAGERDRLNLATYVTGTLSTVEALNTLNQQRATATYNGHMVGNVRHGSNSYTAAGTYQNVWDFGARSGQVTGTFDGLGINGGVSLTGSGPSFSGSGLSVTGLASGSASFNGAFFSRPGDPVAGQGGNFAINGTRAPVVGSGPAVTYQAGGIFAAQKTSSTPGP